MHIYTVYITIILNRAGPGQLNEVHKSRDHRAGVL